MIGALAKKIFGTKNDREIKKITKIVEKINELEDQYRSLSDEELKEKTIEFKTRLEGGETLDDLLVEAFATVREASIRVLNMRHYDVQLIGGVVLHQGKITEMKTGEGKTLVATLPVYLNALSGKGVHLVTVNDYLAKRDRELMGKLYNFLGISSGVLLNQMPVTERKKAYECDVTYGTNSEFGFDYLRDNMVSRVEEKVQRKHNFCIVDEVDSILIDEARTPLIISGPASETTKYYKIFFQVANMLERSFKTEVVKDVKKKKEMNFEESDWKDYEVDEKSKNITLTDRGVKRVEEIMKIDNLYAPEHVELTHYLNQALKAKELFQKDRDYLIREGQVIIIDEFTGRAMEGRRYSDGLHQALEAKEGLNIAGENQTLASITLQNYFRMYEKLAGMTGTAETEAAEFVHTYNLEVIIVPTHRPIKRLDLADAIYRTREEKIEAILEKIEELYKNGQPVLVGTISISGSEELSKYLKAKGIKHEVLNAKHHAKEAEIISQAGRFGAVTIATNMAGRGTDIMLGGNPEAMAIKEAGSEMAENFKEIFEKHKKSCEEEKKKVIEAGGLFILGTERHESRRIDNQLRGRSGRQGDPGASMFYLSLEDDLMRLFGSERISNLMVKLKFEKGESISHPLVTRSIAGAQKKVESRNFGIRKSLLEFDDVMNQQRTVVYDSRNKALETDNLKETILNMLDTIVKGEVYSKFVGEFKDDWDISGLAERIYELYGYEIEDHEEYKSCSIEDYASRLTARVVELYEERERKFTSELTRKLEKYILFEVVDARWRENLKALDSLKEGIYLRSYGQKDPVVEYKLLAGELYAEMLKTIQEETTSYIMKVKIKDEEEDLEMKKAQAPKNIKYSGGDVPTGKVTQKTPCPCGSGKKYKHCCGRDL